MKNLNSNYYCEIGICKHKSCKEVQTIEYIQDLTRHYVTWLKLKPKTEEEKKVKDEAVAWFKETIEGWKLYLNQNF